MNKHAVVLTLIILFMSLIASALPATTHKDSGQGKGLTSAEYEVLPLGRDVVKALVAPGVIAWAVSGSTYNSYRWTIVLGGQTFVINSFDLRGVIASPEGVVWALNYSLRPALILNKLPTNGDVLAVFHWDLLRITSGSVDVMDEGEVRGGLDLTKGLFYPDSPVPYLFYRDGNPYLIEMNDTFFEGVAYAGGEKIVMRAEGRLPSAAYAVPIDVKEYLIGSFILTESGLKPLGIELSDFREPIPVEGGVVVGSYLVLSNGTTIHIGEPLPSPSNSDHVICRDGDEIRLYELSGSGIVKAYPLPEVLVDYVALGEDHLYLFKMEEAGVEVRIISLSPHIAEVSEPISIGRGDTIGVDVPWSVRIAYLGGISWPVGAFPGGAFALLEYDIGDDDHAYALLIIKDTHKQPTAIGSREVGLRKVAELLIPQEVEDAHLSAYLGEDTLAFYSWGKLYIVRGGDLLGPYNLPPPKWVAGKYLYLVNDTHVIVLDSDSGRIAAVYRYPKWLIESIYPPTGTYFAWDNCGCTIVSTRDGAQEVSLVINDTAISVYGQRYCDPRTALPPIWGNVLDGIIEGAFGDAALVYVGDAGHGNVYGLLSDKGLIYIEGTLRAGPAVVNGKLALFVGGLGNGSGGCLLMWGDGLERACLDYEPSKVVLWDRGLVTIREEGGSQSAIVYEVVG